MHIPFFPRDGWMRYRPAPGRPSAADLALVRDFLDPSAGVEPRYELLFRYFVDGFLAAATPDFERAYYRGRGSSRGYRVAGVEGFARTAPLFAAWLAGGRTSVVSGLAGGRSADLADILIRGLSAGADPTHSAYWGKVGPHSQLIVEAADIALTLWLGRETIWRKLDGRARSNLATWLRSAATAEIYVNNWLLFGVSIEAALAALEGKALHHSANYDRFKQLYLGHGWFSDDADKRVVDYYNPWGITYALGFLHLMQPEFDTEFVVQALRQSADLTAHLISPRGIPIMGRSVCYRTAVPAPLVLATLVGAEPPGRARHALDLVWHYFVGNGALRDGTLTQGYFLDDPRVLNNYSGPGSSHWGFRSLIPALLHPPGSVFWTAPEELLPVEIGDYRLDLPELGWRLEGDQASGDIRIVIPANVGRHPKLRPHTLGLRLKEAIDQQPHRPSSRAAAYGAESYSVLDPFPLRR